MRDTRWVSRYDKDGHDNLDYLNFLALGYEQVEERVIHNWTWLRMEGEMKTTLVDPLTPTTLHKLIEEIILPLEELGLYELAEKLSQLEELLTRRGLRHWKPIP